MASIETLTVIKCLDNIFRFFRCIRRCFFPLYWWRLTTEMFTHSFHASTTTRWHWQYMPHKYTFLWGIYFCGAYILAGHIYFVGHISLWGIYILWGIYPCGAYMFCGAYILVGHIWVRPERWDRPVKNLPTLNLPFIERIFTNKTCIIKHATWRETVYQIKFAQNLRIVWFTFNSKRPMSITKYVGYVPNQRDTKNMPKWKK